MRYFIYFVSDCRYRSYLITQSYLIGFSTWSLSCFWTGLKLPMTCNGLIPTVFKFKLLKINVLDSLFLIDFFSLSQNPWLRVCTFQHFYLNRLLTERWYVLFRAFNSHFHWFESEKLPRGRFNFIIQYLKKQTLYKAIWIIAV